MLTQEPTKTKLQFVDGNRSIWPSQLGINSASRSNSLVKKTKAWYNAFVSHYVTEKGIMHVSLQSLKKELQEGLTLVRAWLLTVDEKIKQIVVNIC